MKFMHRFLIMCTAAVFCTVSAWASEIGVVDMQQIFQTAPQVKKINDSLTQKFQERKDNLVKMSNELKEDFQKYQKNKAVTGQKELADLQTQIETKEANFRQEQAKFQQDVFQAQNQEMTKFIDQVKGVVKTVAADKKLDMVLPKNTVLYSQDSLDITSAVLDKLKS
jgi:outer membrane protein